MALLGKELARVLIVESVQCKLCITSVSFVLEHTWIDKHKIVYLNKKNPTKYLMLDQSINQYNSLLFRHVQGVILDHCSITVSL